MMKYMLDTNICIYTIKKKPPMVLRRFMSHNSEELRISSTTYAELVHGHEKAAGLTLVTNNTREFQQVSDLPLED